MSERLPVVPPNLRLMSQSDEEETQKHLTIHFQIPVCVDKTKKHLGLDINYNSIMDGHLRDQLIIKKTSNSTCKTGEAASQFFFFS